MIGALGVVDQHIVGLYRLKVGVQNHNGNRTLSKGLIILCRHLGSQKDDAVCLVSSERRLGLFPVIEILNAQRIVQLAAFFMDSLKNFIKKRTVGDNNAAFPVYQQQQSAFRRCR